MESTPKLKSGTPLFCINQWAIARTNEVLLNSLFSASGNSFSLNSARLGGEKLHIYIGYDGEDLSLYTIPSEADTGSSVSNASLTKIAIAAEKQTLASSSRDSQNRIELIEAINNWTDPANIASWVSQNFSAKTSENTILQTFIIDTTDFMSDHNYEGYFALKITEEDKKPVYTIDLVVVNTDTGQILNLVNVGNATHYRDLARLVPPFGQEKHPSTKKENFGVLQTLGLL
jgi:hypothetical protein